MPAARTGWRAALSSLDSTQFRWLFASNIGFFFAMQGQMIVRSIIAFDLTKSPLALGLINFAVAIPMMLVSPLGGVVADRVERRRLILIGQGILVCSEVAILSLLVLGELQFWHLVTAATLMGCVFPFIMPARSAIIVNIIGKRGLQNAMALQMGGMNATRILGPAAAGFLVPLVGLAGAFAFGSVLYVAALLCMFGVERSPPPPQLYEASVLIGSAYLAQRSEALGRLGLMVASAFAFAFFLLLFALSPYFLLALPLVLIANIAASIFNTLNNTAVQLLIPDRIRGRISSFMMMSFGVTPLGTLPMSAVAEEFGAPVAVALAAVSVIAVTLLFTGGSPALRSVDTRTREVLEAERRADRRRTHDVVSAAP